MNYKKLWQHLYYYIGHLNKSFGGGNKMAKEKIPLVDWKKFNEIGDKLNKVLVEYDLDIFEVQLVVGALKDQTNFVRTQKELEESDKHG